MRLKPIEMNEFEIRRRCNLFAMLTEFAESEHKCVEIEDHKYKTATIGQTSIMSAIKRYRFNNIKVVVNGNRIYLVKQM